MTQKSFTIVELLICVIIIALLVTFALPQFVKVQTRTHQKEAKVYLQEMYNAAEMAGIEDPSLYSGGLLCPATPAAVHTLFNLKSFKSDIWRPKIGDGDTCWGDSSFNSVGVVSHDGTWVMTYNETGGYGCRGTALQCEGI